MKQTYRIALMVIIMAVYSSSLKADPGAPGSNPSVGATGGQFVSGEASGVPLDGGIIEILVAGVALAGMRTVRKRRALS